MYSFRNNTEKNTYLNFISSNYTRTPKSKIVVFNELGSEANGITYYGTTDLVTFPKIDHTTTQLIGGFPAKTCEFEIYNRSGTVNLNGKEVAAYRGLEINGATIWVLMGIFKAEDADIKTNINKRSISFKGTDRTRRFERKYTTPQDITVSSTLKQFARKICDRNGVALKGSLPLASLTLHNLPNVDETTTDRQMLGYIAEINGCIAMIDRDGALIFKKPAAVSAEIPKTKYKALSYENAYGPVNTLYFGHEDYEDTIRYPTGLPSGTEEVKWVIKDNPIVDLARAWWLASNRVPSQILGASMIPFEVTELIDDYIYDIGDIVTIIDKNGNTVNVTVLSISNTSRIKSTLKAETPTGHEADKALSGSLKEQIKSVRLTVDHVNNFIEREITDPEEGLIFKVREAADGIEALMNNNAGDGLTFYATPSQVQNVMTGLKNIKVGGKNLLINSGACFRNVEPTYVNATKGTISTGYYGTDNSLPSKEYRKFYWVHMTADSSDGTSGISFNLENDTIVTHQKLFKDESYVLSFWAKEGIASRNFNLNPLKMITYCDEYEGLSATEIDLANSKIPKLNTNWQKYVIKFKLNNVPTRFILGFYFSADWQGINEQVCISSVQLETGNIATDWTLNEDEMASVAYVTSEINQTNNAISLAVNRVQTLESAGYITTEQASALIKTESDSITAKVTSNIKVGAENLLEDSSACFKNKIAGYVTATKNSELIEDDIKVPSGKYRRFTFVSNGANSGVYFNPAGDYNKLHVDDVYTLSFYAKDTCSANFTEKYVVVYSGSSLADSDVIRKNIPQLSSDWQKYEIVFKVNSTPDKFVISFRTDVASGATENLYISSIQLEKGNIATDWRRSDADVEQSVEAKLQLYVKTNEQGVIQSHIDIVSNMISIHSDNFTLENDGTIEATAGNIGGWTIGTDKLYNKQRIDNKDVYAVFTNSNLNNKVISLGGSDAEGTDDVFYINTGGYSRFGREGAATDLHTRIFPVGIGIGASTTRTLADEDFYIYTKYRVGGNRVIIGNNSQSVVVYDNSSAILEVSEGIIGLDVSSLYLGGLGNGALKINNGHLYV